MVPWCWCYDVSKNTANAETKGETKMKRLCYNCIWWTPKNSAENYGDCYKNKTNTTDLKSGCIKWCGKISK